MAKLVCTDLDRTLLPNGDAPESPLARERFARAVVEGQWTLAYVSGRSLDAVLQAIEEYSLPLPDFAVCDVGTSIYCNEVVSGEQWWRRLASWDACIRSSWPDGAREQLLTSLTGMRDLRLQQARAQSEYKLSYFASALEDPAPLLKLVQVKISGCPGAHELVYSVDETTGTGLLDLLPRGAGKRAAIEHLMRNGPFGSGQVLFAGDSGNDLDVLASEIPSVLVANATGFVRSEAVRRSRELGHESLLYLARGGLNDMNGNYAAGILEGVGHYWPASKGAS